MRHTFYSTGPQRPSGSITISGAKNAATRMMAAAMLSSQTVKLLDFPTELVDVGYKARFIEAIGGKVELDPAQSIATFDCSGLSARPLKDYSFPIRTTYLLAAGQLMREGVAYVPYPGGCQLGERKYDLHVMIWERMGCKVEERPDCIRIQGRLEGSSIQFPISTVGGTENALLCASIASGRTTISNAYVTPEIVNLIELLRLMGAQIQVDGTSHIEVVGSKELRGASIRVVPDRIEALTWIVLGAITGGRLLIRNVPFELMTIPLTHLRLSGVDYLANSDSVFISPDCIATAGLQPFELACGTHPGVISDMQPFFVNLALHAGGRSRVFDYRYPERTAYLEELAKVYDGSLKWKNGDITITGEGKPRGARMTSTDLRGSMAMVLAALVAEGDSVVERVDMAMRGYDQFSEKLASLGLSFEIK